MIEPSLLPSWAELYSRLGERPPRRNRGRCPIHGGDSPCSVALDEDKGVFYCHVCHAGGDKVRFVQEVLHCDFRSAVAHLTGNPDPAYLKPDPERTRRQKIRKGLKRWAETLGKQLRFEHYVRERVIARAWDRLSRDPEDEWAWSWLAWALPGQEALSDLLDKLEGKEDVQLQTYRQMRNDEGRSNRIRT